MAVLLPRLARARVEEEVVKPVSDEMEVETAMEAFRLEAVESAEHPGIPSTFGCPECGGTLWELQEGELTRFRCRVGHAYSPDSWLSEQSSSLETALWTAFCALEAGAGGAEGASWGPGPGRFGREADSGGGRAPGRRWRGAWQPGRDNGTTLWEPRASTRRRETRRSVPPSSGKYS